MSRELRVDVWYGSEQRFGHHGTPQKYINILGRATSPVGVSSVRWGLKGEMNPLPMGPTAFRLRSLGDFNIELDTEGLAEGEHTLRIVANDMDGDEAEAIIRLHVQLGPAAPLPMTIDWSTSKNINDVAQVVDGLWRLEPGGVRPVELHYDRVVALGDMRWTDYQVTLPVTFHGFSDCPASFRWPSYGQSAGVLLRWQGHYDWGDMRPRRGWNPLGGLSFYGWLREHQDRRAFITGGRGGHIATNDGSFRVELGRRYMTKFRVQSRPNATSRYAAKYWADGEAEPDAWMIEGDGQAGELAAGSALLVAHHTDITYGNVIIEPA
ncbi:MAG: hypothetical protein IT442_11600 [Phycisphaeraceae bacterium]|nr:hypothetical protein [Phycisphaeraceae bacterium]